MVFRAIGSGLFLTLGAIGSDRSAPSVWNIAFIGDFVIGTTALFLAYKVWKKPSAFLWGILLAWNEVGIFDLFGALSHSFGAPFSPFPETRAPDSNMGGLVADNLEKSGNPALSARHNEYQSSLAQNEFATQL